MINKMIKTTAFLMAFIPFSLLAQDTTSVSSTSVVTQTMWYTQPWVWLVGGVLLLLILIAIFSGGKKNSSTDRVIVTKTVRTESE